MAHNQTLNGTPVTVTAMVNLAERVGYEPTVPLQAHAISSRAYSSTLASLLEACPKLANSRQRHDKVAERVGFEPTMKLPPY